jgi:hypothetical protein
LCLSNDFSSEYCLGRHSSFATATATSTFGFGTYEFNTACKSGAK